MLALTRRINEEVVIGDPDNPLGVIRVVSVHGDKVRLSFDFPRDIKINRRELADLKKQFTEGEAAPSKGNGNGNGNGNGQAKKEASQPKPSNDQNQQKTDDGDKNDESTQGAA